MATKIVHVCDRCGKPVEYDSIYAGELGRIEAVDLCPLHCRKALADLVALMPPEWAAASWVKAVKEPLPVVRA